MAIVIEEERGKISIVRILGWIGIVVVIVAAIYYIFITQPELVVIQPPSGYDNIAPIAQITLHPEDVLNSTAYTTLKPPQIALPTPQGPGTVGRPNPFLSP